MGDAEQIYLDHAASTPLAERVRRKMAQAEVEAYANASSIHAAGRRARRYIEEAREAVAAAINGAPKELVFTSGATEADNLAVKGLLAPLPEATLVTSPLEHSAVLAVAHELERHGRRVHFIVPNASGEVDSEALTTALDPAVGLVALMLVNNETGVRTDIEGLSRLVHDAGALLFCDAVQAFGFEDIDVAELGVDALALSAHKAYGPKGIGALWLRAGTELSPLSHGGEQERGLRPGTLNTVAIAGFGEVARLSNEAGAEHGEGVRHRRDRFEGLIEGIDGISINGCSAPRGPKHSSVSVEGVDGELLMMSLDSAGVYASTGSACSAGSIEPSHVLTALGLSPAAAKATVRFSFGMTTGDAAVEQAAERFEAAVARCRRVAV